MASKSALVTGGAGFVGSHLSESLIADGYEVFCVDNFGSGRRENIASLLENPRFRLIDADIREKLGFPSVDEVYHLASRASPTDFTSHPVRIALTNTEGTRNLLDYAVDTDAQFLYASTSEVYGDPTVHPQSEDYNGNVNIRGPRGCYDEAKRFGETLTVVYNDRYDLDVRTVRIFNTYGPRMRPDDGRVVPTFLRQALADEDITIHGEGEQTRSFCYVSDLVAGIRSVMEAPAMAGDVVNLGKPNEITIRELAERVLAVVDTDSDLVHVDRPADDPERRCPDIGKAEELLGYEPEVDFEEGLARTVEYYG
jgi:UDP-glucuronate decarboxylase